MRILIEMSLCKMSTNIQREEIRAEGLVATLFSPQSLKNKQNSIILTLGGGAGGLSEFRAQLLASNGLTALCLAYFGCNGLPSHLQEIPLEYFEKALNWLQSKKGGQFTQIILWGVSRGSELALLIGSLFPEKIKAIIAYVPSSVVYGSLIDPLKSAWIYKGKPIIPNAPFPCGIEQLQAKKNSGEPISLTPFFLQGMKQKEQFQASAILVEQIQCPLLLISGEDDQMWPSTLFANQIQKRLKIKKSSIPCFHYSYPNAGHSLTPFSPHSTIRKIHSIDHFCFNFGGNPTTDAKASLDAWEKTICFLRRTYLSCDSRKTLIKRT